MYTIYPSKSAAIAANATAAEAAGCNMVSTIELYARINHADGRSALEDGTGVATKEELIADGWFVIPE